MTLMGISKTSRDRAYGKVRTMDNSFEHFLMNIKNALFNKCTACNKCTNLVHFLMDSESLFSDTAIFKNMPVFYKLVLFYICMSHPTALIPIIMQNL